MDTEAPHVVIHLRDASLERIVELKKFATISTTETLWGPGTMAVKAPGDTLAKWLNTPGLGIEITSDADPEVTEFSGLFMLNDDVKASNERIISITGKDDHGRLNHRGAYPDPTDVAASAAVVRSGQASTILLDLINQNAGPAALQPRRIPGLVLEADPLIGADIEVSVTGGQGLLSIIKEHAPASDLIVRARQDGEASIKVVGRAPRDRTNIVFSARSRSLNGWQVRESGPKATVAISAGPGSGIDRVVVEVVADPLPQWPERIEAWVDSRNAVDPADPARNLLAINGGGTSLKVKVPDKQSGHIWARDYDLGDIVTVQIGEVKLPLQITAAKTTHSKSGKSRYLTMGPPIEDFADAFVSQLTALTSQLRSIERS